MIYRQRVVPGAAHAWRVGGGVVLVAMVVAQVGSGLNPSILALTSVIVVLIAVTAVCFAAAEWSAGTAAAGFLAAVGIGYAAEWIGVRTGLPFGDYRYTDVLWPQLGGVPVIVALAWGGMGLAAYGVAGAVARGIAGRVLVGALALTAWDLFLDPQMLRLGLWVWADPGPYRGVPLGNFAGWLLVSALVMLALHAITTGRRGGRGLLALYTVMAVMETVAFAFVFEPRDLVVAVAGGAAMGVLTVAAWRGASRWPTS